MFPASTNSSAGQCFGFPDACKTPPVNAPIPYPNIGMLVQADPGTLAKSVLICGFPAATLITKIPMSSGDEAGINGGVISGKNMGSCKFTKCSGVVKMEGNGSAYLGSIVAQNNDANPNVPPGTQTTASQSSVTVGP